MGYGRLWTEHVDDCTRNRPALQRIRKGSCVDKLGPSRIDENTIRLQECELRHTDQPTRLVGQSRGKDDDLRRREQDVKIDRLCPRRPDLIPIDVGVVHEETEPETPRDRREGSADATESDYATGAAVELRS